MNSCPKCGAQSDEEAEILCVPEGDDCPMACCKDWNKALEKLTAEYNPTIYVYEHLKKIVTGGFYE